MIIYNIQSTSTANNFHPIKTTGSNYIYNPFVLLKLKIHEFIDLPNNWDGYDSSPLLTEIGDNALLLIATINSFYIDLITDIFPNPNGTLTIEWENKNDEKISLEIGLYNYSYFVKYANKEPKLANGENIIVDIKELTEAIGELFSETFLSNISS